MPPPVIRYAITNRHLRAADEGEEPAAATPREEARPLDRSDREAVAPWRDPQLPAADSRGEQDTFAADLARLTNQAHLLRAQSVDYLQLREKDLRPANLRTVAAALRQTLPAGSHPRLLLNLGHPHDHAATLATALAIAADGLHLPASTPAEVPAHIRATFARACRSTPILSISAHTLAEVTAARAARLDLILFGPVFGKFIGGQTVTPPVGLRALTQAAAAAGPIPVLALGGITLANTDACLAAGARGIAGIRLFL